jgi:hypothetical protein
MPEREFNGQRIIVTGLDERPFYFDCWSMLDVDGRTYAPIDISLSNANDLYEQRLNDILIVLTLYVFKGP